MIKKRLKRSSSDQNITELLVNQPPQILLNLCDTLLSKVARQNDNNLNFCLVLLSPKLEKVYVSTRSIILFTAVEYSFSNSCNR